MTWQKSGQFSAEVNFGRRRDSGRPFYQHPRGARAYEVTCHTMNNVEEDMKAELQKMREMQIALMAEIQLLKAQKLEEKQAELPVSGGKRAREEMTQDVDEASAQEAQKKTAKAAASPQTGSSPRQSSQEEGSEIALHSILSVTEKEKELAKYRHEGDYTFRIARPPRLVRCREAGEQYLGLPQIERIDMVCTAKNYTPSCPAQRIVDRHPITGKILSVRQLGSHTEHKMKRQPMADPDVRRLAKAEMVKRTDPSDAEDYLLKRAAEETPGIPIEPHRTMNQRQLQQLRTYENRKVNPYPSSEIVANIAGRFGAHLLATNVAPVRFTYMSQWQRQYASTRKLQVLLIDSTFKCIAGDLLLTTLLVRAPAPNLRVYFPIAWSIHEGEDGGVYTKILRDVNETTPLKPLIVLRDFAYPIKNAITHVWPTVLNVGDLFHFLHDNRKWLTSAQVTAKEAILTDLRRLAIETDSMKFITMLKAWEERYRAHTSYMEYFKRTWSGRIDEWSLASRSSEYPSGDQPLEAYHLRLQMHVFNGTTERDLLSVISCLDKEAQHWEKIISSPQLLEKLQKEKERRAASRFHTVAELMEQEDDIEKLLEAESAVQMSTTSPTTSSVGAPTPDAAANPAASKDDNNSLSSASGASAASNEESEPSLAVPAATIAVLRLSAKCQECKSKRSQVNQRCTHRVCAACCEKKIGECGVPTHNRRRNKNALKPVIDEVKNAMNLPADRRLWIKYNTATADVPRWYNARAVCEHPLYPGSSFQITHHSATAGKEVVLTFKYSRLHAVTFANPE